MNEAIKELAKQFSDPLDYAVVLLVGAISYVFDAGIDFISFLEPEFTAYSFSAGALGIKKAFQPLLSKAKTNRQSEKRKAQVLSKVENLKELLILHIGLLHEGMMMKTLKKPC